MLAILILSPLISVAMVVPLPQSNKQTSLLQETKHAKDGFKDEINTILVVPPQSEIIIENTKFDSENKESVLTNVIPQYPRKLDETNR